MGESVSSDRYTPQQRTRYRQLLMEDLEIFDRHLQSSDFEDRGSIGLELELNLVDKDMQPALAGEAVLSSLNSEYQSEIGNFNVELNHPPLSVQGDGLKRLEDGIGSRLSAVREAATAAGVNVAMIGTLPTVTPAFLEDPAWMTQENRYRALSNTIMDSRGEMVHINLADREQISHDFADIAPESTCTSIQLHLQLAPTKFAAAWNASQAIAGVQVALAANSPLFLGRRVWHESRIPVFQQAIDTRTPELVNQGVRPRVWFGERWITSVFDLFEENVRYFSPLIAESRALSGTPMMKGKSPALHYLNLHNGTVWRWNRPIYAPGTERAHLRLENRLLPAGPTPIDITADAAFYYGLVKYLAEENRPVWSRLPFPDAEKNFQAGARSGLFARMTWPTLGQINVADLVLEHLLPQARIGLQRLGVDENLIDTYLGIIEGRAKSRQNGATWQLRTLNHFEAHGSLPGSKSRQEALAAMLRSYLDNQLMGEPVHTWKIG
ncbi:glutamate-cysteine ligase family protein [Corynebacterium callunae]|uniref:glutamate-cysteine ligase family protein n=1 Tax=Corynebacterium callunae TaxID=1721 RepID=UPI001FFF0CA5|nr:glutamate-cysteine ligase family protein [Corynebacterium callunae]MCK2199597.1 glutamate-cysteine ligase family protein [Corynebacterium callunae]